jgi:hypothetical protein
MGVLVLGMHRSGTSVAARVINLLGVPFGRGRLVPTTDANPLGHWEHWALQDLNNDLLHAFGGNWAGPPAFDDRWEYDPRAEQFVGRAAETWLSAHRREPWVWKDPRTCLTLPFWRRAAGLSPVAILIYRHPREVASSLAARNGFSTPASLALWERYTRDALTGMAGWPVLVTSHSELLADPVEWAKEVREFLVDHGVAIGFDGWRVEQAARSVVPDLRRSPTVGAKVTDGLSVNQTRLVETVARLMGGHEQWEPPELGPASPWMDVLIAEQGRSYERELALLRELNLTRSQLGHVINRTRAKVLIYRLYDRVTPRWLPRKGQRG